MSASSWLDWDPEAYARRQRSLEDRASLAFKVLALLNLPGLIVAPFGGPPSSLLWATSVGATIGLTILYVLEARALDRRRWWAILAARPLLAVVVVFGGFSTLVAFEAGWLKVPLDACIATWAWLSLPATRVTDEARASIRAPGSTSRATPGPRSRAVGVVVAALLLDAGLWYGGPVFGWGGLLDVHQPDLTAALHVDCGPPGAPPATLTVSYDWSWRIRPPFPSGTDVVVVGWRGVDGQGRALYLLGDTPDTGIGIEPSHQGPPSLELAQEVEAETPLSWHWGVHLDRQGLAPGHIEFQLDLTRQGPPRPGPLTIRATYIHVGLWRQDTPTITCSW